MKHSARILALLLAAMMVFSLLSACGSQKQETAQETPQETAADSSTPAEEVEEESAPANTSRDLVVGTTSATCAFDPAMDYCDIGGALVYDTLFVYNPDTGELEGRLAESWEYLDDTTLEIHLRDNVYFTNGEKLCAEDVLFTLERFITEGSRRANYFQAYDFEACEIVDDLTVILKTKEPYGPQLNYLAQQFSSILCKSYVEANDAEAFWDKPNGTGPYVCTENVSGSYASYERKDDYWGELPEAETITVRTYSEASTMAVDLENKVLDMAFSLNSSDAERFLNETPDYLNVILASKHDSYNLCLPEYVEAFQDIRVREAIAYAIDREAIAGVGLGVLGTIADSSMPDGVDYKIDVYDYEYDPDKARELLAEAEYADGDIVLDMVCFVGEQTSMGEALQAYLAEVGIVVNVQSYDMATAVPMFIAGDTDVVWNSLGSTSACDPAQVYANTGATSTNASVKITDETVVNALTEGSASVDAATRQSCYETVQNWLQDNCRYIPIANLNICYAYNTSRVAEFNTTTPAGPNLCFVHFA